VLLIPIAPKIVQLLLAFFLEVLITKVNIELREIEEAHSRVISILRDSRSDHLGPGGY